MKPTPFPSDSTPWRVYVPARWSDTGKRQAKYFTSKNAANDFCERTKEQRKQHGRQAVTAEELAAITLFRRQLGTLDQLPAVLAHWQRTGEGAIIPKTISEATTEFIAFVEAEGKTYGKRTASDIRWRLKGFAAAHDGLYVYSFPSQDVQSFLEGYPEGWSRKSWHKRISAFFRWCEYKRYVIQSPMKFVKKPDASWEEPDIYSVEDMQEILKASESDLEIKKFIILSGFGYVRNSELIRMYANERVLEWQHVLWGEGLIHVPHGVAKKTRRALGDERWPVLNDTVKRWLKPLKQASGQIVNVGHVKFYPRLKAVIERAGVEQIDNGFRHSCLSYSLSAGTSMGDVAKHSGSSETTLKRHYIKSLKPVDARKWWAIKNERKD